MSVEIEYKGHKFVPSFHACILTCSGCGLIISESRFRLAQEGYWEERISECERPEHARTELLFEECEECGEDVNTEEYHECDK